MKTTFFFNSTSSDLLFKGLDITTTWEFALICLLFAFAAIFFEVLVGLSTYLTRRYTANPLDMDWRSSINDRSPLLAPLQIPSRINKVTQRRCRIHFGRTLVHMLSVALGYTVMLVVMTYNAYYLISIVLGSSMGYLIFAPLRRPPKKKKPQIDRRAQRDNLTRSGQMDTGDEREGRSEVEGSKNINYYDSL